MTDTKAESLPNLDPQEAAPDPFGLDLIPPADLLDRAVLVASHLDIALRGNAPEDEVRSRSAELRAILERVRADGFAPPIEASGEPAPEADEPMPAVSYAETPAVMIVPLAYPFEIEGQRFDRLEFRPPSFAMVERVMAGKAAEIDMQAEMAGVTPEIFRSLRWPDAEVAIAAARHIAPSLIARKA